jgi:DNA-binding NarL/FixJ family response regulator
MINGVIPALAVTIISRQCLVWLGLQKILESRATVPMVVHLHQERTPDRLLVEGRSDVFILDLETVRDAVGTIEQIREAATSKIVLLCGLEDHDCAREAFACGVDGVILKIQPPEVVLAVIEALYAPAKLQAFGKRDGLVGTGLETKKTIEAELPPAWPEALTEREREIIRLVGQGLSNKDIADKLSISDGTVRHHMTSIFDKVGVPNRQKLLIHAYHIHSIQTSVVSQKDVRALGEAERTA